MKQYLILFPILLFTNNEVFSQRKQSSIEECVEDIKAFIKFIDTLNTLECDF
jgi:hypothetical protein